MSKWQLQLYRVVVGLAVLWTSYIVAEETGVDLYKWLFLYSVLALASDWFLQDRSLFPKSEKKDTFKEQQSQAEAA